MDMSEWLTHTHRHTHTHILAKLDTKITVCNKAK